MKEDVVPLVIDKVLNAVLHTGTTNKATINKIVDEIAGIYFVKDSTVKLIKQRVNAVIGNEAAVRGAGQLSKEIAKLKTIPKNEFAGELAKLAKKDLNILNASARGHERVAKRAGGLLEKVNEIRPGLFSKAVARGEPKALKATSMLDDIIKAATRPNGKAFQFINPEKAARAAAMSVDLPITRGAKLGYKALSNSKGLGMLKPGILEILKSGKAIPDIIKTPPAFFSMLSEKPIAKAAKTTAESIGKELVKYAPKEATKEIVKETAKDSRKLLKIGKFAAKHKGKLALLGITGAALIDFFMGNGEPIAAQDQFETKITFKEPEIIKEIDKLIKEVEDIR